MRRWFKVVISDLSFDISGLSDGLFSNVFAVAEIFDLKVVALWSDTMSQASG
jgi:hypothetical protein